MVNYIIELMLLRQPITHVNKNFSIWRFWSTNGGLRRVFSNFVIPWWLLDIILRIRNVAMISTHRWLSVTCIVPILGWVKCWPRLRHVVASVIRGGSLKDWGMPVVRPSGSRTHGRHLPWSHVGMMIIKWIHAVMVCMRIKGKRSCLIPGLDVMVGVASAWKPTVIGLTDWQSFRFNIWRRGQLTSKPCVVLT